jgi:TnpA family transposase
VLKDRRTLLSSEQRNRLFAIPTDLAEMAKHDVLSAKDLALVKTKRRSGNRLGFAIQLCLLRHPGQGLGSGEHPPEKTSCSSRFSSLNSSSGQQDAQRGFDALDAR